jgi:CelD/BcsL family acetyltransferase involved in cellulose biosynthesis
MQMRVTSPVASEAVPPGVVASDGSWLAAHALEPNFTLMPQWLEPLAAQQAKGRSPVIFQTIAEDGRPAGLVALNKGRWRWGLPVSHLETFFGGFPISGTPLLNPADPAGAARSLIGEAFAQSGAAVMLLSKVTGHHVVSSVLVDACAALGAPVCFLDDCQRAALRCNGDHDAWFEASFSRKRRKEFRRLKARLGEQGALAFEATAPSGAALDDWIEAFCSLEKAGWKGRAGTAIGSSDNLTAFLQDSLHRLSADGKLVCWSLTLDGKPVAMMFGICDAGRCWIVKIARDEALDRFSPGQLLVLEVTRWLFEQDGIMFADSCAEPGHPMIDHIWRDKLDMRDVLIGRPGQSAALFALICRLERARRAARTTLKTALARIRKGRPS